MPWWVAMIVIPEMIFIVAVVALWRKKKIDGLRHSAFGGHAKLRTSSFTSRLTGLANEQDFSEDDLS